MANGDSIIEYKINIDSLQAELYNYALGVQREYFANKTVSKYRIKYAIVSKIYHEVNALKDEKSIRLYAQGLFSMSQQVQKEYQSLYSKYIYEINKTEKARLTTVLNECAARLNAYNETYNIINKYLLQRVAVQVRPVEKKQPVSPVSERREINPPTRSASPTLVVPSVTGTPTMSGNLENEDTLLSDKIIGLLEKYNELDKNTSEAQAILDEVYNLRVNRENKFKELYGSQYRIFISELESYENMAAILPSEGFKTRELDSNNFILELRTAINAVNEYHFMNQLQIKKYYKKDVNLSDGLNENRNAKKFNNFLRKYHVLITSLFKNREVLFQVDGVDISTEDLVAYLGTCNLDGDYSVYKNKFNSSYIGTEEANRKKYIETLTFLNKCINALCELAKNELKGGKISVVDTELTKPDIIKKRNARLNEIYYLKRSGRLDGGGMRL